MTKHNSVVSPFCRKSCCPSTHLTPTPRGFPQGNNALQRLQESQLVISLAKELYMFSVLHPFHNTPPSLESVAGPSKSNSGATISYRFDSWMIIKLLGLTQSLQPVFLKANLIPGQASHLSIQPQQYHVPGLYFIFEKYGFTRKKLWLTAEKLLAGPQPGPVGKKKDCAQSTQTTDRGALMLPFAAASPTTVWISQQRMHKVSRLASLRSLYILTLWINHDG